MDRIIIKGLRIFAYHGVGAAEKEKGQPFELDIVLHTDVSAAGASDRLADTVNYAAAAKLAAAAFTAEKNDLLERAATRVAEALLAAFPTVVSVAVTLKKPRAPIAADFAYVAVEVEKHRMNNE